MTLSDEIEMEFLVKNNSLIDTFHACDGDLKLVMDKTGIIANDMYCSTNHPCDFCLNIQQLGVCEENAIASKRLGLEIKTYINNRISKKCICVFAILSTICPNYSGGFFAANICGMQLKVLNRKPEFESWSDFLQNDGDLEKVPQMVEVFFKQWNVLRQIGWSHPMAIDFKANTINQQNTAIGWNYLDQSKFNRSRYRQWISTRNTYRDFLMYGRYQAYTVYLWILTTMLIKNVGVKIIECGAFHRVFDTDHDIVFYKLQQITEWNHENVEYILRGLHLKDYF